jgi:RES domain-containing protein
MKLWRLARDPHTAFGGAGAQAKGGRYVSAGRPVVHCASEAGLAVLVALRYVLDDKALFAAEHFLCHVEVQAVPDRMPDGLTDRQIKAHADAWLATGDSMLMAIRSAVLPEGDVILLNPRHRDAGQVGPMVWRPFRFSDCLHRPPILDAYRGGPGAS